MRTTQLNNSFKFNICLYSRDFKIL